MKTQAGLVTGVHTVALGEVELPAPASDELLIETAYSCVSPGTELRCLAGLQPGQPEWPFIPGYAQTGSVIGRGEQTTLPIGTRVFCRGTQRVSVARLWGGHIGHAVVREGDVFALDERVGLLEAAGAALAAIALHGVRVSRPQIHETVAVVGLGPIGQFSARLHQLAGARVVATDRVPERVALARAAGIEAYLAGEMLASTLAEVLPHGADVIVDATGARAVLPQAIEMAKDVPWGDTLVTPSRLLIQGSYPADVSFPYQEAFRKELTLQLTRDYQPRDLRRSLELIASGALAVRDLISIEAAPAEAAATYAALSSATGGLMTAVFNWK
ncbi:MAG: zinc-binding dehydrogenase [Roseiflexaceae bacterium]|nr:zinc-binding dehydrogenase [Roseiflexaceae bacterium]